MLALLLLTAPTRAELLDPGTGMRLTVTSTDQLVELDPATGKSRVLMTLPGLHAGRLVSIPPPPVQDSIVDPREHPTRYILVQADKLTALGFEGQVVWTHELEAEPTWGPERAGEATVAFVVDDQLHVLELATGKGLLAARLPGQPRAVLPADGNWLLVIPPKEPTPPDYGYRRPPQNPPPPPEPDPEQLVLVDGRTGETLWSLVPVGKIEDGPWPMGERVLEVEQGTGDNPFFLVSLEPVPHILKGLQNPWNYPIQELPSYQWDLALTSRPLTPPEAMGDKLMVLEKNRVIVVDQDTGALAWDQPIEGGELALSADGKPLVIAREADVVVFVKQEKTTQILTLNRQTGNPENQVEVAGEPLYALPDGDRLRVFFKTTASEPTLDTGGHAIINPKTREPEQSFVESFQLVDLGDEARVLLDGARQTLVGAPEARDGVLYYATRLTPPQTEGQTRPIDVKYPQEPILLHAFDLKTDQELWTYRPAAPDDRIDDSWAFAGPRIWFATPDHRVILLDPKDGKVAGVSPILSDAPAGLEPIGEKLLVSIGDNAYRGLSSQAIPEWAEVSFRPAFDYGKLNNLIGVTILVVFLAYFIFAARKKQLFIRRIAGLNALDEAVGRATEMGKPVLYVHGLADVDDIQVLASLSILGHVAKKTAEYDTPILVPCSRSVVMSTAQEVVKESYTAAGRPDAFQRDNINYLTDEQFGYVAGVDGIMLREKPAANFYLGTFYAESLILAETGHSTGAIQIAGTAMPSQLPFFVSACDYTLIGEELYAASAYLSRDPMQVGSLRGQDVGKAVLMICIFLGAVLVSFHIDFIKEWFQ